MFLSKLFFIQSVTSQIVHININKDSNICENKIFLIFITRVYRVNIWYLNSSYIPASDSSTDDFKTENKNIFYVLYSFKDFRMVICSNPIALTGFGSMSKLNKLIIYFNNVKEVNFY